MVMLKTGVTVVQDDATPMSVCIEGDGSHRERLVCQVNGNQRIDGDRDEDARTVVAALNAYLNPESLWVSKSDGEIAGKILELEEILDDRRVAESARAMKG